MGAMDPITETERHYDQKIYIKIIIISQKNVGENLKKMNEKFNYCIKTKKIFERRDLNIKTIVFMGKQLEHT